ncbi:MAG: agmatine deiminase family protein [Dongiaceae bacterium]
MAIPAADGFRLPAPWAPHLRCWMAWPAREESWGENREAAREAYAEIAGAIARFEPVTFIAKPKNVAEVSIATGENISTFSLQHDDAILGHNGPVFVVNQDGIVAGVDWQWNGWGGRYIDHERDAAVAALILEHLQMRRYEPPLVLDGGAIVGDGEGTLIASERVILDPARNVGLTRSDAEIVLRDYLGIEKVIWLPDGLAWHGGPGHVETVACFAKPGLVLALGCSDSADPNFALLQENLAQLRAAHDAAGRTLDVVEIEQPRARAGRDGNRLPLSYVSLYVANGGVVMPAFEDPQDKRAYEAVSRAFAGREVTQVPAGDIADGGSGLHAITLAQPDGPPAAA